MSLKGIAHERLSQRHQADDWLGIDFSGNWRMWTARTQRSNVWIARIHGAPEDLQLSDLRTVQELDGHGDPFERLVSLLAAGKYRAAGIDAPFSLPNERVPESDHCCLLARVAAWDREDRPFPRGSSLVRDLLPNAPVHGIKEFRATEMGWAVNVRSTLWNGPRGGAPMTAACLTLLHRIQRPVWPFAKAEACGLVVEAFPAAQLRKWALPFDRYNGRGELAKERRATIVQALRQRVRLETFMASLLANADALDAVLCCFAGIAVTTSQLARHPSAPHPLEGAIAVHI